jgi:hypothetical protein
MFDVDYAPAVMFGWICMVLIVPALYGVFLVDKYWKKNKAEASSADDAFN